MPITPTKKIWMNGTLVDWDDATIHVLNPTLHYGWGVFEGIRAYGTSRGPAVFRLTDHIARLFRSAKVYFMEPDFTAAEIVPIASVDDRNVGAGKPGPITRELSEIFSAATRGEVDRYKEWNEHVRE